MKFFTFLLFVVCSFELSAQLQDDKAKKSITPQPAIQTENQWTTQSTTLLETTRYNKLQKNDSPETIQQRANLIQELAKKAPNSGTYYFNVFLAGGRKDVNFPLLQKAYEKSPNNVDILEEMVGFYARKNDFNSAKIYLKKLKENHFLNDELISYSADLLIYTLKNATLFFHGFDDTYSALYAQQIQGVRTDIKIIDLDWMTITDYRNELKKEKWNVSDETTVDSGFLADLLNDNPTKIIGISLTFPKNYLTDLPADAKLFGTMYLLHASKEETISWRQWKCIQTKPSTEKGISWTKNYLPYLYLLRNKAFKEEELDEKVEIENAMLKIANWNNETTQIQAILRQ